VNLAKMKTSRKKGHTIAETATHGKKLEKKSKENVISILGEHSITSRKNQHRRQMDRFTKIYQGRRKSFIKGENWFRGKLGEGSTP